VLGGECGAGDGRGGPEGVRSAQVAEEKAAVDRLFGEDIDQADAEKNRAASGQQAHGAPLVAASIGGARTRSSAASRAIRIAARRGGTAPSAASFRRKPPPTSRHSATKTTTRPRKAIATCRQISGRPSGQRNAAAIVGVMASATMARTTAVQSRCRRRQVAGPAPAGPASRGASEAAGIRFSRCVTRPAPPRGGRCRRG